MFHDICITRLQHEAFATSLSHLVVSRRIWEGSQLHGRHGGCWAGAMLKGASVAGVHPEGPAPEAEPGGA